MKQYYNKNQLDAFIDRLPIELKKLINIDYFEDQEYPYQIKTSNDEFELSKFLNFDELVEVIQTINFMLQYKVLKVGKGV